jgi:hypothetical protein
MADRGKTGESKAKPRIREAFFIIELLKDMRIRGRKKKKVTTFVKETNRGHLIWVLSDRRPNF